MRQGTTNTPWPANPATDEGLPAQAVRAARLGLTTWTDTVLLILSLIVLSLSVFSGPLLSVHDLVVVLGVGAGVLYAISTNGATVERIAERRLALFLAILLNVYLVSLTHGEAGRELYGSILVGIESAIIAVLLGVWGIRLFRVGPSRIIQSPLDVAVLLLSVLTSVCFVGPYLLLRLNGLPAGLRLDLLWVVLLSTLLYYSLRGALHSEPATKNTLRVLLFPMGAACVSGLIAPWLAR